MPNLLDTTAELAKRYFMEPSNYVNFDLPFYFDFSSILQATAAHMGAHRIHELFALDNTHIKQRPINPKDMDGVNYKLLGNKDGEFAWRPFEVIHPALYVALVNELTDSRSWAYLQSRFRFFRQSAVSCESMPYISEDKEKHKAHQVRNWWENVELQSLRLSLSFNYVYDVDIADCYGSIYTHSIAWALHDKATMKLKENRDSADFLGNRIDWLIQKMRHGQTNGIPQGSTIMDFIAEIVLGHIDTMLTSKLDDLGYQREDYAIIRYRDDFKIFSNSPEIGKAIVKELSTVLSDQGLRLNASKTKLQSDPVLASLKPDKLYELFVPNNRMTLSKRLLQIYKCADVYPNSGMITRQLYQYYRILVRVKRLPAYDDARVMIGIVVNLAVKNPRTYQWSMAILSNLLDFCPAKDRLSIIDSIRGKFSTVPNTGMLDVWLQRISYKVDPAIFYSEALAQIASGEHASNVIWRSEWLKQDLRSIVSNTPIIKQPVLDSMSPLIAPEEVALFTFPYQ